MDRVAPTVVADVLLSTPAWARLALAAPDPRLRERAAETIGAILIARLSPAENDAADDRQLVLPIA